MFLRSDKRHRGKKRKKVHLKLPAGFNDLAGFCLQLSHHQGNYLQRWSVNKLISKDHQRFAIILLMILANWFGVFFQETRSLATTVQTANIATLSEPNQETIKQTIKSESLPLVLAQPLNPLIITQGFAPSHQAVDLEAAYGMEVRPIAKGVVEKVGWDPTGRGIIVIIKHEDHLSSLYAHLAKITVQEGENVDVNTIIGLVGATGRATGSHLHLEVVDRGQPVNPLNFLPTPSNHL